MYYLMIKTHNITKLKYLCKCSNRDPYTYKGSGVYWKRHLKEHGVDISTEVLYETEDLNKFSEVALEYSIKFDVKNSKEWANLMLESGLDGGTTHHNPHWLVGFKHSEESKKKISEASKARAIGRKLSDETKDKISATLKGRPMKCSQKGEKKTPEHRKKLSDSQKGVSRNFSEEQLENSRDSMKRLSKVKYKCSVCGKIANAGQIGRWHKQCMENESWQKTKHNEDQ